MPAPEETTDDSAAPEPEDRWDPDLGPERAEAGAARSPGRTARIVILTAVLAAAVLVALRAAGVGQEGSSSDDGGRRTGSSTTAAPSSTAAPSTAPADSAPSSSVAPPDVEPERAAIDLAAPTATGDPVEVARWWAAVLVTYQGAEPATDVVARLAPFTSTGLEQELLAVPPAASYDAPVEVTGASAQVGAAPAGGGQQVTVSVETPGALVVYELVVVQDEGGAWVVDQATRV